ncbi:MAG: hypothetical protein RLZZ69_1697, partial [Cyanobacteriota bacterium]
AGAGLCNLDASRWVVERGQKAIEWLIEQGGLSHIQQINEKKAKLIYDVIDNSNGFYR